MIFSVLPYLQQRVTTMALVSTVKCLFCGISNCFTALEKKLLKVSEINWMFIRFCPFCTSAILFLLLPVFLIVFQNVLLSAVFFMIKIIKIILFGFPHQESTNIFLSIISSFCFTFIF